MENLPAQFQQLVAAIHDLQSKTAQFKSLSGQVESNVELQNQSVKRRIKITGDINQLKADRQNALQKQNNNLATLVDEKLKRLELTDLPREEHAISTKDVEIRELKQKQDLLRAQGLQQLNNTFHSFDDAVAFVMQQDDYFVRYIWLIYLRDNIQVRQLNFQDFPSFTDQASAKKITDNFEKELSASEKLLTEQDKKDIDGALRIKSEIVKDEKRIADMKRALGGEDDKVKSFQQKLDALNAKSGYPPKKLSNFLMAGLVSIVIAVILLYFAFAARQDGNGPNIILLLLGLGSIIAGAILLWLRYSNNKEKRIPEITSKLETAQGQFSRHTGELQALEQKAMSDKTELTGILTRRPILQIMTEGPTQ